MYLGETDISGLLSEALTADVDTVLADQTVVVGADAAVSKKKKKKTRSQHFPSRAFSFVAFFSPGLVGSITRSDK